MDLSSIQIPWQEFDLIFGTNHILSLRNLNIKDHKRAKKFLSSCGFSPNSHFQKKQFEQIFIESLFFIRHHLLYENERESYIVPADILYLDDPCYLILYASDLLPKYRYRRTWSCLVLKVMYVISAIHFNEKLNTIDEARDVIFKRIKDHLIETPSLLFHCNDHKISLKKVEWKEAKSRSSMILKMLNKPQSVSEEIQDYLGVRFVVENEKTIPLFIKCLINSDIIIPHQTINLRTRNSLLNIKDPRKIMYFFEGLYSTGTLSESEFMEIYNKISWKIAFGDDLKRSNSFSSQHYKSLQFTVRHLIRSKNPAFQVIDSLTKQLYHHTGIQKQEPWIDTIVPEFLSNYFPFEIQIMDEEGYNSSKYGLASYEQYKSNQLNSAREKVLKQLLRFDSSKLESQEF